MSERDYLISKALSPERMARARELAEHPIFEGRASSVAAALRRRSVKPRAAALLEEKKATRFSQADRASRKHDRYYDRREAGLRVTKPKPRNLIRDSTSRVVVY